MRGPGKRLPAARPGKAVEALPATLDISPGRAGTVGRLLVALAALAATLYVRAAIEGAGEAAESDLGEAISLIQLALAAVAAVFAGRAGLALMSHRSARLDGGRVSVSGRTPFHREEWSEPLTAYRGVSWRVVRTGDARGHPGRRVFQVIELVHPNPARTVPLYVRETREDVRGAWEGFARLLHLPAIDARDGAPRTRAPGDLDKSLRTLAEEGRLEVPAPPAGRPPAGIDWQGERTGGAETLVVRLHARRFPGFAYAGVVLAGAFLVYAGLVQHALLGLIVGGALAGLTAWCWLYEPGHPRELRLSRTELTYDDSNLITSEQRTIPLAAIEEIRLAPPRRLVNRGTLVIASDRGEVRTGQGLSPEALAWLRDWLTAAVVGA